MGQTVKKLASATLNKKPIFPNRFVVESCEDFHFHYRNLRIRISYADWPAFAKGFADSYYRWEKQGRPFGKHTELCRKIVATNPCDDGIQINLNKNLYKPNEGEIFAEGAEFFDEEEYVHLKVRDLRLELRKDEFLTLAKCVKEAEAELA